MALSCSIGRVAVLLGLFTVTGRSGVCLVEVDLLALGLALALTLVLILNRLPRHGRIIKVILLLLLLSFGRFLLPNLPRSRRLIIIIRLPIFPPLIASSPRARLLDRLGLRSLRAFVWGLIV